MTKRIKIGVAGAGVFGGYHCSKIADLDGVDLSCVYDLDPEKALTQARKHNVPAETDFDALLDRSEAVVIAAPAIAHYELALKALNAGRHVFVEKPVALALGEADELIALARTKGLVLQVGHQERYVAEAVGLFDRKKPPVKIDCIRHTAATGRCEDVSVVLDLMIHDIDLIRKLTGAEIETVVAYGERNAADAELTLDNGTSVMLAASRRDGSPERRMTLVYDDGVVEFDFINRTAENTTPSPLHACFDGEHAPLSFTDPLAYGAAAFAAAVAAGDAPQVTGMDGRQALDWALRIEEAAGIDIASNQYKTPERRRA
ncbi:Gfo/Idh/MocA family protein [Hyphococcus sp.]|uniref:Gfo/Idh/MocA family protein n=1 Tax=Hyphococcus sp. TaxID=2038636 RepID=UPI0035C70239